MLLIIQQYLTEKRHSEQCQTSQIINKLGPNSYSQIFLEYSLCYFIFIFKLLSLIFDICL